MKAKLITLHLKNRRETIDAKYRRIGKAINLRKNVSRAALDWYWTESWHCRRAAEVAL